MDDLTSQGCGNGIEFIKFEDYWRQGFLAREANISRLKSDLQISIYYQVCGNFTACPSQYGIGLPATLICRGNRITEHFASKRKGVAPRQPHPIERDQDWRTSSR